LRRAVEDATLLWEKAQQVLPDANPEDASELRTLLTSLRSAIEQRSEAEIQNISSKLEDIVFYLADA
jgi:hypothetical protein